MKRTWEFTEPAASSPSDVTVGVKITGIGERTITVTLFNTTDQPIQDPLTVEILVDGEVVETLEDATLVTVNPETPERKNISTLQQKTVG